MHRLRLQRVEACISGQNHHQAESYHDSQCHSRHIFNKYWFKIRRNSCLISCDEKTLIKDFQIVTVQFIWAQFFFWSPNISSWNHSWSPALLSEMMHVDWLDKLHSPDISDNNLVNHIRQHQTPICRTGKLNGWYWDYKESFGAFAAHT